jgi:hypothetical protein
MWNGSYFVLGSTSDCGKRVYFDRFGFSRLRTNAVRFETLVAAVCAARVTADSERREVTVLDADDKTLLVAPVAQPA